MKMALCHYHIYSAHDETFLGRNLMCTDWFKFNVSIVYRSSSIHLNSTNYERFRFIDLPTVACKSFFTLEGQYSLHTSLSGVQHFTSELLEQILPPITSWIQALMFKVNYGYRVEQKRLDSNPLVFPLNLDIEFELPHDYFESEMKEKSMRQVELNIPASKDATESPRIEYCTICLGECQWCGNNGDLEGLHNVL
ncbi:hypothetical protein RJT34_04197 [Clitoria ternatea]|uniref:Uncharacterized protein n=1 Tax=Clitoria ternatea TaxID=43366 RepID=A0AAN9Q202_CLITE